MPALDLGVEVGTELVENGLQPVQQFGAWCRRRCRRSSELRSFLAVATDWVNSLRLAASASTIAFLASLAALRRPRRPPSRRARCLHDLVRRVGSLLADVLQHQLQGPRLLGLAGRRQRVRTDLDGLGDERGEIGGGERLGFVDDRAAFAGGPALRFAGNVLVAHGESFDLYSGEGVVEVGLPVVAGHGCLLG